MIEKLGFLERQPLVVHVVYRFDTGGVENGIVNLINHLPAGRYRHAIVALTQVTDFKDRIEREDVAFYSLNKPPGHGLRIYPQLFRLFRNLRPAIVHSRNLAALEAVVPAWMARVPVRIHGEHGRDVGDLNGSSRKHRLIRRLYHPFVSHYVALSRDLATYLVDSVNISSAMVTQAYNGVDSWRFRRTGDREAVVGCPFTDQSLWLIGTVGRMQVVKDQPTLVEAFIDVVRRRPELAIKVRLVMVGDGPLRARSLALLESAGLARLAWLPGERSDVPAIMGCLDCFVLPSLAEGISNTILEAMACELPVIATDVGGNGELVISGETGEIVPVANPGAIADCLVAWVTDPERSRAMGRAGRRLVECKFDLAAMLQAYQEVYDQQLGMVPTNGAVAIG